MHVCLELFGRDLFSEQCISHNYTNWRSSHNPEGIGIPVVFPKMWVSVIWMFFMEGGVLEVHHATHRNKKCFVCANIRGKISDFLEVMRVLWIQDLQCLNFICLFIDLWWTSQCRFPGIGSWTSLLRLQKDGYLINCIVSSFFPFSFSLCCPPSVE